MSLLPLLARPLLLLEEGIVALDGSLVTAGLRSRVQGSSSRSLLEGLLLSDAHAPKVAELRKPSRIREEVATAAFHNGGWCRGFGAGGTSQAAELGQGLRHTLHLSC